MQLLYFMIQEVLDPVPDSVIMEMSLLPYLHGYIKLKVYFQS